MKIYIETERLILREILPTDEEGIFKLNSDPEVLQYLDEEEFTTIEQSREHIDAIRQQYIANGIGRWAVINKADQKFIGWAGLKYRKETFMGLNGFYDLGYRIIKKYWGKGYATEASKAAVEYAFHTLKLKELYAMADTRNIASRKILEKVGMKYVETIDWQGVPHDWFKVEESGFSGF